MKRNRTLASRLNAIRLVLTNTNEVNEIKEAMAAYGYTDEVLAEGHRLLEEAEKAVFAQDRNTALARDLSAREKDTRSTAMDSYMVLAKILRAHFIDKPEKLTGLALRGPTPRSTAAFLHRARTLLMAIDADPEVGEALKKYNIDEPRLQSLLQTIENYASVNQQHEAAKAAQQTATVDQKAAIAVAWDWRARFIKVARVALRGHKELLEALGIKVRPRRSRIHTGAAETDSV